MLIYMNTLYISTKRQPFLGGNNCSSTRTRGSLRRRVSALGGKAQPAATAATEDGRSEDARPVGDTVCGIPRAEFLKLQGAARYMGNEWGAVHKPWESAGVRFTLAYPEARELFHFLCLPRAQRCLCTRSTRSAPRISATSCCTQY